MERAGVPKATGSPRASAALAAAFLAWLVFLPAKTLAAPICACEVYEGACRYEYQKLAGPTDSASCKSACFVANGYAPDATNVFLSSFWDEEDTLKRERGVCTYHAAGAVCLADYPTDDPYCGVGTHYCLCRNVDAGACRNDRHDVYIPAISHQQCEDTCKGATYQGSSAWWQYQYPGEPDWKDPQKTHACLVKVDGSKCVPIFSEDNVYCNPIYAACACEFNSDALSKNGITCKGRYYLHGWSTSQSSVVPGITIESYTTVNLAEGGEVECKNKCEEAGAAGYRTLPGKKDEACYYGIYGGDSCSDEPFNFGRDYTYSQEIDATVSNKGLLPSGWRGSECPARYCFCRYPPDFKPESCQNRTTSFGAVSDENVCRISCEYKGLQFDKTTASPDEGCSWVDGTVTKSDDAKYDGCAEPLNPKSPACGLQSLEKSSREAFLQHGTPLGLNLPLGTSSPQRVVGRIISQLLGVVGGVALLFFIYGGVIWMTAAGNPEKVKKGRATVVWAVIGIAAIFAAYAFINFLTSAFAG